MQKVGVPIQDKSTQVSGLLQNQNSPARDSENMGVEEVSWPRDQQSQFWYPISNFTHVSFALDSYTQPPSQNMQAPLENFSASRVASVLLKSVKFTVGEIFKTPSSEKLTEVTISFSSGLFLSMVTSHGECRAHARVWVSSFTAAFSNPNRTSVEIVLAGECMPVFASPRGESLGHQIRPCRACLNTCVTLSTCCSLYGSCLDANVGCPFMCFVQHDHRVLADLEISQTLQNEETNLKGW